MKWQRGYKFSLLSQVLLFKIITTVQIYLGQDWISSKISKICQKRSWQVQSCALNSKKQLYTPSYVCEVRTWARWAKPHLLQHRKVQSLVSEVPNLGKPSRIKSSRLFASQLDTQGTHTSQKPQNTHLSTQGHQVIVSYTSAIEQLACFSWAGILSSWQPKDYQPFHTCRQDSTNNDLRLPQCNIHYLYFQKLHLN